MAITYEALIEKIIRQLPNMLFQVTLGVVLGDGSLYNTKKEGAKLKLEQGYKHKAYVEHFCLIFKDWTFYKEPSGIILKYLNNLGLCYWIADNGSLQKNNERILHTQSFSYEENIQMCEELHQKFQLHTTVVSHKKKWWVIYIPASDAQMLRKYFVHLPECMKHKKPRHKDSIL